MSVPHLGRLLESICHLQQAQFVAMPTDDLDAHRESIWCKAAGHRDGGEAGHRDVVAGPHPVNVGVERFAVDLGHVGLGDVEGWHLTHREDQVFVSFHEQADPLLQGAQLLRHSTEVGT